MCRCPTSRHHVPQLARRVLVVEDDDSLRRAILQLLTIHGFEVISAASLDVASSQLSSRPDIILTDLNLPDGSGLDLLRRVRQMDACVAIAVMTGNEDLAEAARALGPDAIFSKPFDIDELIAWLENPQRRGK
jgi:DNA-binding response OmpR family regulator